MTIAVYGATGYLGRLVTDELARRRATFVLGGRDRDALDRRSREVGGAPARVATIDDPPALAAFASGCAVVLNCAGPSFRCGEPLVRASIATGAHYVDAAGEQPFIRVVFEEYSTEAERRGVALVPGAGFDYALGDCLAALTARQLQPARDVTIAYAIRGSGVGGNSVRFAVDTPRTGEVAYRDGRWQPVGLDLRWHSFDFPEPFGRLAVSRYGAGEVITVPRHTQTRALRVFITTRSLVPHRMLVPFFPVLRPVVASLLRTPVRLLLAALTRRVPAAEPQLDERHESGFAIGAHVLAEDGRRARGMITGRDFHGVTASALAHVAIAMADPGFRAAGARGVAAVVDPAVFLDAFGGHDVRWSVTPEPALTAPGGARR